MKRHTRGQLYAFDGCRHFVYVWVELAHAPNHLLKLESAYMRDYERLLDSGVVFYIGRGKRKRLTDMKDRNPEAVSKRDHLSIWRSFGFNVLGGFKSEADAKELEEALIKLYDPLHNLQYWNNS